MNVSDSNARDLLATAERAGGDGARLAHVASRATSLYSVAVGVLVATFLLISVYVFPLGVLGLTLGLTAGYLTALTGAVILYTRLRIGSPAGWGKRYYIGFSITIALYLAGIFIATGAGWTSPLFWAAYAILVALPVSVAGVMKSSR